jgi:hypothetical protein
MGSLSSLNPVQCPSYSFFVVLDLMLRKYMDERDIKGMEGLILR